MQGFTRPRLAVAAITASAASLGGLAVAAPAHALSGNIVNVNGSTGSDTGAGGTWRTIAEGVQHAQSGDTVAVAGGTYAGFNASGLNGVTIQGSGQATVTSAVTMSGDTNVTLDGVTITGVSGTALSVSSSSGLHITRDTVTNSGLGSPANALPVGSGGTPAVVLNSVGNSSFDGNPVANNAYHGVLATGGPVGLVISHNTISGNVDPGEKGGNPGDRFAAGLKIQQAGVTVFGNVLHDNQNTGLQVYTGGDHVVAYDNISYRNGNHGIDNLNVSGGVIVNNTVYDNCTAGINVEVGVKVGTAADGYTVENNISVDNGTNAAC